MQCPTNIVGNNNPNYSDGRENSFCLCGKQKDYRANQCSLCAHKSVPKDKNSIPSKEEIENVIKNSSSFLEASAKISFSRQKLKVLAEEYNIDISHFKKCNNRLYSSEELLTVGGKRINGTVRALILRENLLPFSMVPIGIAHFRISHRYMSYQSLPINDKSRVKYHGTNHQM